MKHLLRDLCVCVAALALLVGCASDDETSPSDAPPAADVDASSSDDTTGGDAGETGDAVTSDAGPEEVAEALYTSCTDTLLCVMDACDDTDDGDFSCLAPCVAGSSEDAASGFNVFFECMDAECFGDICGADDAADDCVDLCMKSKCGHELLACLDPGTFGEGDCFSGMECLEGCGEDEGDGISGEDYPCLGACMGELEDGEKGNLADLLVCLGEAELASGGEGQDPFEACPTEAVQCLTHGASGEADCVGVVECIDACGEGGADDLNCMGDCLATGTADAQASTTALLNCLDDGGEPGGDSGMSPEDAALACLQESCGTELFGCLADSDCLDALTCVAECGEDEACQFGCLAGLSEQTTGLLTTLGTCSDENGCDVGTEGGDDGSGDADPLGECLPVILDCAAPSNDAASCADFVACLEPGEGDDGEDEGLAPFLHCLADNNQASVDQFLTAQGCHEACFVECGEGPGPPDQPDPMACLQMSCGTELGACSSTEGCQTAMLCMSVCDGTDEECEAECQGELSDEDKALLLDVELCGLANGCLGGGGGEEQDEGECVAAACEAELGACLLDTECKAVMDCHDACDNDPNAGDDCQSQCMDGVSEAAAGLFTDTVQCAITANCWGGGPDGDEGGCVVAACGEELGACIADTECKAVMDCHDACDSDPNASEDCHSQCLDGVSEASAGLFTTTVECAIAADCYGSGPGCVSECLASDACGEAIEACGLGMGPSGSPPPDPGDDGPPPSD